jgi:hypothetical protein
MQVTATRVLVVVATVLRSDQPLDLISWPDAADDVGVLCLLPTCVILKSNLELESI